MVVVKRCGVALLALGVVLGCGESATAPMSAAGSGGSADGGASGMAQGGDTVIGAGGSSVTSSGGVSSGGNPSTSSAGVSSGGAFSAGSGGASEAGAPPDSTLEPIRIIRGDPQRAVYWDLTVRGVALDEYEGKVATVRVGIPSQASERLGSGQARIQGGAFELSFPQVWEDSLYKQKLVYIDVNDDGSCDLADDKLFADSRGVLSAALIVRGSGARGADDFSHSQDAEHCAQFNSDWPSE